MLQVGVAYREASGRLWLAVSERDVVRSHLGTWRTRRVNRGGHFVPVTSLTVEDLCRHWKVTAEAIDLVVHRFLAPVATLKARLRDAPRKARGTPCDVEFWRDRRSHRLTQRHA